MVTHFSSMTFASARAVVTTVCIHSYKLSFYQLSLGAAHSVLVPLCPGTATQAIRGCTNISNICRQSANSPYRPGNSFFHAGADVHKELEACQAPLVFQHLHLSNVLHLHQGLLRHHESQHPALPHLAVQLRRQIYVLQDHAEGAPTDFSTAVSL